MNGPDFAIQQFVLNRDDLRHWIRPVVNLPADNEGKRNKNKNGWSGGGGLILPCKKYSMKHHH